MTLNTVADIKDRLGYATKASQVVAADVIMFSGCKDSQTSSDVGNTSKLFELPDSFNSPGSAGGACTNAMVLSLSKNTKCIHDPFPGTV